MNEVLRFFGFLVGIITLQALADLPYTHEAFNRLNPDELESLLVENPHQKLQMSFFKAEAFFLSGKPHAAQELIKPLTELCTQSEKKLLSLREEAACLLIDLNFSQNKSELVYYLNRTRLEKRLRVLSSSQFSFEERAYLEGRLLWRVPEGLGGSVGKSLVALESLKRLKPNLSSLDYFKAEIFESEGKTSLALEALQRALQASPPDSRALLKSRFKKEPGGFFYSVVANPAGGTGLLLGYQETRIQDENRQWSVSLSGQSRGVYRAKIQYQDQEVFPPWRIRLFLQGAREIDQFFGMGSQSQLINLTEIIQNLGEIKLGAKKSIAPFYVGATLGGFLRKPTQVKGVFTGLRELSEEQRSFIPEFEAGLSQEGKEIGLVLLGAQENLFSTHTFSAALLKAQLIFSISPKDILSFFSAYRFSSDRTPYAFLTTLSGNIPLMGVRPGRFRDNQGGGASLKWEHAFNANWRLVPFGNLGAMGSRLMHGGGVALGWGKGAFRSQIEWGHFAGESLILAGIQWADG